MAEHIRKILKQEQDSRCRDHAHTQCDGGCSDISGQIGLTNGDRLCAIAREGDLAACNGDPGFTRIEAILGERTCFESSDVHHSRISQPIGGTAARILRQCDGGSGNGFTAFATQCVRRANATN